MNCMDIKKTYKGFSLEIKELSFRHDITAICGHVGSGKTTLLKTLMRINNGRVAFDEEHSLFMKQDGHKLPKVNVSEYLQIMNTFVDEFQIEKARELLHSFKIEERSRLSSLSSGEKDTLLTIIALSVEREYILLDEPFSRIDPFNRKKIVDLIIDECKDKRFIIATHELDIMTKLLDYVVLIKDGKLLAEGKISTIEQDHNQVKEWYRYHYQKASA